MTAHRSKCLNHVACWLHLKSRDSDRETRSTINCQPPARHKTRSETERDGAIYLGEDNLDAIISSSWLPLSKEGISVSALPPSAQAESGGVRLPPRPAAGPVVGLARHAPGLRWSRKLPRPGRRIASLLVMLRIRDRVPVMVGQTGVYLLQHSDCGPCQVPRLFQFRTRCEKRARLGLTGVTS